MSKITFASTPLPKMNSSHVNFGQLLKIATLEICGPYQSTDYARCIVDSSTASEIMPDGSVLAHLVTSI
jgi:hypothetical protein